MRPPTPLRIIRGGGLTRCHTPVVTRKQDGGALTEELIKIAGPMILQQAQAGLQDIKAGRSLADVMLTRGLQLQRGLKRKAPALAWAVGKNQAKNTYKRATKRVRDIFSW